MFLICGRPVFAASKRVAMACRGKAAKPAKPAKHMKQPFEPKNVAQKRLTTLLGDDGPTVVVVTGPAGCGKTFVAATMGAIALVRGVVDRIVLCRPAVTAGEDHGYLPGNINAKMAPWARPMTDAFKRYWTADEIRKMVADEVIELCPLAYCRGRTFERAWVLLDEASSCTPAQMRLMLTRVGEGSRMVVMGDLAQSDIGGINGLRDLEKRMRESGPADDMGAMAFDADDVVRHPVVAEVLRLYGDEQV